MSCPPPPPPPQQVLFPLPTPLPVFALLTGPGSELPAVCIGVSPRPPKSVLFHTVRFGALSCWLGDMSTSERGGAAGGGGAGLPELEAGWKGMGPACAGRGERRWTPRMG